MTSIEQLKALVASRGWRLYTTVEPVRSIGWQAIRLSLRDLRGRELITDWEMISGTSDPACAIARIATVLIRAIEGRGAVR